MPTGSKLIACLLLATLLSAVNFQFTAALNHMQAPCAGALAFVTGLIATVCGGSVAAISAAAGYDRFHTLRSRSCL